MPVMCAYGIILFITPAVSNTAWKERHRVVEYILGWLSYETLVLSHGRGASPSPPWPAGYRRTSASDFSGRRRIEAGRR